MKLRIVTALLATTLVAGTASAAVSVFDFEGDLSSNGPAQMSLYKGNAFGTFGTEIINGAPSGVLNFPAATVDQGLEVLHNAPPNGGGSYPNQYTIGYDLKFVNAGGYAGLFQTNTGNANDGDLFRNGAGGLGISGDYDGVIEGDKWYRLMFSFDIAGELGPGPTLYKYINGQQVGSQVLVSGVDGRWALDPTFLILTDEDGETNAGAISMFLFADRAMTAREIGDLGGPNTPIPGAIPEPASLALLAFGALPALRLRRASR